MRKQQRKLSFLIIIALVIVMLASSVMVASPADSQNPALSTKPSIPQPTTDPTVPTATDPTVPTGTTPTSEPTQPSQPTETTAPTTPTAPSEPTKPTEPEGPSLQSRDAFVYDCRTGKFLFTTGDIHDKLYVASITKLYTAYVALMYLKPTDIVTVGNILDTLPSDSSIALLNPKDKLSVADLILGMLLPSGGDAARVLAVAAGKAYLGTTDETEYYYYEAFVREMNRQAQLLGMNDSNFKNPDGYHDPDHYMSLADAARLGELCLTSSRIMESMQTKVYTAIVHNTARDILWTNTNKLIFQDRYPEFYHPQAVGGKTGYTSAAGNCLLSTFMVEDGYLIIGAFGSETRDGRFNDTLKLFKYVDA